MGYYTRFRGRIDITPPLTPAEFSGRPFDPKTQTYHDYRDVVYEIEETHEDLPDGSTLSRRLAVALVPLGEEEYKGYDIVKHVEEAVTTMPDGHTANGVITCAGEDTGDVWRIVVADNQVTREKAKIVWPDGTEYTPESL